MEQPCEELCLQILRDNEFWDSTPMEDNARRWCTFANRGFGDIRRATNCPLCRIVFQALMSCASADILNDETTIYYSHELLLEYKTTHIEESIEDESDITSFRVHQVKYLNVSTSSAYRKERREFAWIGATSECLNTVCEVDIARLRDLDSSNDDYLFYERPITPRVDTERIKQWLRTCDNNHPRCGTLSRAVGSNLWMINVHLGMLETAPTGCCYAALSFCHGDNYHFFFDDENALRLRTKGFLSGTNLEVPQTIRDAITVTKALGLEYLWVDTLCVYRETSTATNEKRSTQKPHAEAYSNSYVTLVATGENAECGLFGVKSPGRKPQARETYNGLTLAAAKKSWHDTMHECPWNFRRWTFEEAVKPRRHLIFSEEQVFFRCQQSFWAEAAWLEGYNDEFIKDLRQRPVHSPYWLGDYYKPAEEDSFETYMDVVDSYSKRKSFQSSDNLKAFQSYCHQERLIYGLPPNRFAEALCFEVYEGMRPEPERQGVPSWSWLAWKVSDDEHGVYPSLPVTIYATPFYRPASDNGNKAGPLRWCRIGQTEEGRSKAYRRPLAGKEISTTIAAFGEPTVVLEFLRRGDCFPGTAFLTVPLSPSSNASLAPELSKRRLELSATLSSDYEASPGKQIKALFVMVDGNDLDLTFRLLLIEEETPGAFRRVGMCDVTETEWVEARFRDHVSFEDIFIY